MEKYLVCFLVLILVACNNPFSTREAEPPGQKRSNWIPPSSPDIVLINLRNSIADKNVANYLRCLVDTSQSQRRFQFIPDQSVKNKNPGVFDSWGIQEEKSYINQLFSSLPEDSTRSLLFQNLKESPYYPDSTVFTGEYRLILKHIQDPSSYPREVEGRVEFWLAQEKDGDWSIYHWTDMATGEHPCWSDLKAAFGK